MTAETPARRLLIIGLDGATLSLVQPWAAAGLLPHLAGLMQRGTWGRLRSTVPALTAPSWASFLTGTNPGKHGVYSFRGFQAGAYESTPLITAKDIRNATLWDMIGRAGLRVGVVNVPPSYPLRPVNGFAVSCMFTPPGEREIAYPPELGRELDGYRIVVDRSMNPLPGPNFLERALAFIQEWRTVTDIRVETMLRLAARHPSDVLAVVFYTPDRLQHFFWSHLDPDVPDGATPEAAIIRREVQESFRRLDDGIGALLRTVGEDGTVVIVSDHGFGPIPTHAVQVNQWLAAHGFLSVRRHWRLRRRIVRRLPRKLKERWNRVDNTLIHRDRTRAWCDFLETRTAGIWIHVAGRYPLGTVAPGAEYAAVADEIRRGLLALRDPDGDAPFLAVEPREALYHGPATADAPDLLAITTLKFGVRLASLKRDFNVPGLFAPYTDFGFSGAHQPLGLYILAGPQVRAAGEGPEAVIEDVAPTVLALLGLPVPAGLDGRVMTAALDERFLAAHPPRQGPPAEGPDGSGGRGWQSAEDEQRVEEQLRALGYVE